VKKVIVTGATGMLGVALIKECEKNNISVAAISRPGSKKTGRLHESGNVKIIECGLDEIDRLGKILKPGYDAFFHLGWADTDKAGRNDAQKQEKNIEYTLKAAGAAATLGCGIFIGAGSQAEYGRYDIPIKEDFETRPDTAYGRAKLEAGKKSAELCAKLKIRHVWTRIFSVYGPNDSASTLVMYCIGKMLKNERVSLTQCTQVWDFLFCADAAKALMLAAEKGKDKAVYNIGGGSGQQLKKYVNMIADITGGKQEPGFGDIKTPENGLQNLEADISGIRGDTGFMPAVGFDAGIRETIKWYKENYK
jgi:nucleoside-diphosphate-sugar epimerase